MSHASRNRSPSRGAPENLYGQQHLCANREVLVLRAVTG